MTVSAADRKTLLALVEQAQLAYLLTRYPKKQVLDDAGDVARLEKALDAMRDSAKRLSVGLRERHPVVAWDDLAKKPESVDVAWRRAKRVAPTVLRELVPDLEGVPEAAFFLRPDRETPKKATGRKATRRPARASRRPARAGRRT